MASQKRDLFTNNNNVDNVVLQRLISMFGNVIHIEIIKSVASSCNWQLEKAKEILGQLSASVGNKKITSKQKFIKNSNINSVAYKRVGIDDSNVDVLIEEDSTKTKRNFRRPHNITNQPIKNSSSKPIKPKVVQNKCKREIDYDRVRNLIRTGAKVCVLLRGLPGSGKTHLAQLIIQTTINEDFTRFIYSTDDYFIRNGAYNYNSALLADAHFWNQKRVYEAIVLGISPIIVDNTNTQLWEMKSYAEMAVNFGYAVEILEPMTVWIFNPPELTRRNIHRVPKNKIVDMLDRYEKNITVDKLFSMYNLAYLPNNRPPQQRLYPPLNKTIQSFCNITPSIARSSNINETPSQAKPKKKRPRKKKSAEKNCDPSLHKTESLISVFTSDSEESWNNLHQTNSQSCSNIHLFEEKLMNVNDSEDQNATATDKYDHINLIDFDDNAAVETVNLSNNESDNKVNRFQETTENFFNSFNSCMELISTTTINNASGSSDKSYPKVDLSAWGLTDDALISWELVEIPKAKEEPKFKEPLPQRQIYKQISREEAVEQSSVSTNTSSEDFALLKNDFPNSDVRIVSTNNRNITENFLPSLPSISKVVKFDKSTMTGRENILNAALNRERCSKEEHHFSILQKLFPDIREDVLKDIFEKCQGDINWTCNILFDDNHKHFTNIETPILDVASNHDHTEDCECTANYDIKEFTPEEPENKTVHSVENKKCSLKIKNRMTNKNLQSTQEQLKQIFQISDSYYSPHVLNIRKKRHGDLESIPSTSSDQFPSCVEEEVIPHQSDEFDVWEENSEDEIIEMNVGLEFIEQLEEVSGLSDLNYPKGFKPILHLPINMVRTLHAYWLESVYQQMDAQTQILEKMLREDEELARKLQEQEAKESRSSSVPNLQEIMDMEIALAIYKADQEQWKKETPDDLASRMKRQKLFELFPTFDQGILLEVLLSCNNNFDHTVEVLKSSIDPDHSSNRNNQDDLTKRNELMENAKKEYIEAKKAPKIVVIKPNSNNDTDDDNDQDDDDACCSKKTPTQYREEANHHFQMRQLCFEKAQAAIKKGCTQVATYYSEIAQMHKQKYEHANSLAATAFLSAHSKLRNENTLDLHFLYVKEAEQALAMFIDEHIYKLKSRNKLKVNLFIITGRGNHSKDGISIIKPVVKRHLKDRSLDYIQMNPGFLRITLYKHSILTNDMRK